MLLKIDVMSSSRATLEVFNKQIEESKAALSVERKDR